MQFSSAGCCPAVAGRYNLRDAGMAERLNAPHL
jgi:hypothetical protein